MDLTLQVSWLSDPVVLEAIGSVTFVTFLLVFIAISIIALIKRWVVVGWIYKEKEREVRKLEDRLKMMEALAVQGTHMAHRGTETAEFFAYRERQDDDPH